MAVQGGPLGGAAATFSGNWHYNAQTQILTINANAQVTFQILSMVSNMGVQHFIWLFRITGGSARFINVVDEQGTPGMLELVARPWMQKWLVPVRATRGIAFGILLLMFAVFLALGCGPIKRLA